MDYFEASPRPLEVGIAMNRRILRSILISMSLGLALSCNPVSSDDAARLSAPTPTTIPFRDLDYENIDHLLLLNRNASSQDRQLARDSLQLAKRMMGEEGYLFPRVQLEEAITTHPTPEIVLHFANGFLRVAQYYLLHKDANLQTPLGNHDVGWYLRGAMFYYRLASEFSKRVEQPFDPEKSTQVADAENCISRIIADQKFLKVAPCRYPELEF